MYRNILILLILTSGLTTYGQGNWTNYPTPAFRLFDMDFRTRDLGIAVDTDSILLTKDGGVTWKKSYFPGPYPFNCKIDLINNDQDTIYFFTDFNGKVYKGTGFNDSAKVIYEHPNLIMNLVDAVYKDGECFFVGIGDGKGQLVHMSNYGTSFQHFEFPELFAIIRIIPFFNNEVVAFGRDDVKNWFVLKSVDDGASFYKVDSVDQRTTGIGCHGDTCLAVSEQKDFRISHDRGDSWVDVSNTFFFDNPKEVIWLDKKFIYTNLFTGEHLIFSKDGGYTWQYDSIGSNDVMRKIQYVEGMLFLLHDHSLRKREFSGIGVPEVDVDPLNVEVLVDRKNTSLSIINKENTTAQFAIYSLMGQVLFEGEITESEHRQNYSSRLSNKIGILRVQTGNRIGSRKFVF